LTKAASPPHMNGSIVFAWWRQYAPPVPWTDRVHIPNDISIGSAVFAQLTAECFHTLQWAAHFTSKLPLYIGV